jgi:hypothetical protein
LLEASGCSSAWIEHCFWEAGAEGSNPFTPIASLFTGTLD